MVYIKKLVFVPLFLIVFSVLISQINPFFKSYDFIFSLSTDTLNQLIILSSLIVLSSLFFVLFCTFTMDWKIILPVIIFACLIPLLFLDPNLATVLIIGLIAIFAVTFLTLENSLKSYLNFQPSNLLGPSIRHLTGLLILIICIVYFLSANNMITQKGFQIPDSLIDSALKFIPEPQIDQTIGSNPLASIPKDQIDMLKKNPELLKQYGLDPKMLDSLNQDNKPTTVSNLTNNLIKQTVKDQTQNLIKPYLNFIPAVLAVLFFLTLQSITSILSLLISPIISILFSMLEKTGFAKFTTEMRPVKKLIA